MPNKKKKPNQKNRLLKQILDDANRDPWSEHMDTLLDMRKHAKDMGMDRSTTLLVEELIRRICSLNCSELPYDMPEKANAWCRNCGLPAPHATNKIDFEYPAMHDSGCSTCGYYHKNDKKTCRNCQRTLNLPEVPE